MEVEKKYLRPKQMQVFNSMEKGKWYNAYNLHIPNAHKILVALYNQNMVDMEDDNSGEKFFSNNIHHKFKIKDDVTIINNIPKIKKRKI
ncbi:MAG: hypothetical protein WC444_07010 [Candidatus Paceibacterota bacterium]